MVCTRLNREPPFDECDSLAHPKQANALAAILVGGEPLPVVLHKCSDHAVLLVQEDADPLGISVFDDVVERLLDDTVDRRLYLVEGACREEIRARQPSRSAP